jgi:hypothetical protein
MGIDRREWDHVAVLRAYLRHHLVIVTAVPRLAFGIDGENDGEVPFAVMRRGVGHGRPMGLERPSFSATRHNVVCVAAAVFKPSGFMSQMKTSSPDSDIETS